FGAAKGFTIYDVTSSTGRFTITPTGLIGIGTHTPGARLTRAASTTSGGGLLFGTDTNLYRSAANVMTTDDSLTVGGSTLTFVSATGTNITATNVTSTNGTLTFLHALTSGGLDIVSNNGTNIALLGAGGG